MKYEQEILITDNMTYNYQIRPEAILDLFQSIAGMHANIIGCGLDDLLKHDLAFILLRTTYDVYKPIKRYTRVKVVTWPNISKRIEYDRTYEIRDISTDELLVKGASKWVLMDLKTRRIARNAPFCIEPYLEGYANEISKIDYSSLDFIDYKKYIVSPLDVDVLGHFNNTKYVNMIPQELYSHLEINYVLEAKLNDEIILKKNTMVDTNTYLGLNNGNISVVIKTVL